jgi:hypothetical protein
MFYVKIILKIKRDTIVMENVFIHRFELNH